MLNLLSRMRPRAQPNRETHLDVSRDSSSNSAKPLLPPTTPGDPRSAGQTVHWTDSSHVQDTLQEPVQNDEQYDLSCLQAKVNSLRDVRNNLSSAKSKKEAEYSAVTSIA